MHKCVQMKFTSLFTGLVLCFTWAATPAEAGVVVAEYLPPARNQSNGILDDTGWGQTFVPNDSGLLESVGLIIDRRGAPLSDLLLDIRTVSSGDEPSTTILGTVSLSPGEVPFFIGGEGFFDPPETVLTFFDFTTLPPINLVAGTKYALVARAPGSDDPSTPLSTEGYGWYVGPASGSIDGNFSQTSDNGASFSVYPFNFDGSFRVTAIVPEPATWVLLLGPLALMTWRGRRR